MHILYVYAVTVVYCAYEVIYVHIHTYTAKTSWYHIVLLRFGVKPIVLAAVVGDGAVTSLSCCGCVAIFSTKSNILCTIFSPLKNVRCFCLLNVLVFCCPEARQGALYAVSQGLNLFLGGPTENGASEPKTAQQPRRPSFSFLCLLLLLRRPRRTTTI